ncbi:hypothetical protein [Delftia acidovorans]
MKKLAVTLLAGAMCIGASAQIYGDQAEFNASAALSAPPQVWGCNIARPGPDWVAVAIEIEAGAPGRCPIRVPWYNYQNLDPSYYSQGQVVAVCQPNFVNGNAWAYLGSNNTSPTGPGWYPGAYPAGPCKYVNNMNTVMQGWIHYYQRR